MGGSIKLGNVFGIPVRLHWTFLLVPYLYILLVPTSPLLAVLNVLALFGTVFLHELGHSLVARHFGIRVVDITFWPLGGMARMTDVPESSRIEGLVAIAGPAVNYALALLAVAGSTLAHFLGLDALGVALLWFMLMNLLMGTFNLLPAFPMDGGRILRAWFARSTDWVRATEQAVTVGRFFAALMVIAPIVLAFTPINPPCVLGLIGVFVWFAGARELMGVRLRHGQPVFGTGGSGGFRGFGGFGGPGGAPGGGGFGGRGPREAEATWSRDAEPAREAPAGGAQRPAEWSGEIPSQGFSELDVRELERFRGRLKDRPDS